MRRESNESDLRYLEEMPYVWVHEFDVDPTMFLQIDLQRHHQITRIKQVDITTQYDSFDGSLYMPQVKVTFSKVRAKVTFSKVRAKVTSSKVRAKVTFSKVRAKVTFSKVRVNVTFYWRKGKRKVYLIGTWSLLSTKKFLVIFVMSSLTR